MNINRWLLTVWFAVWAVALSAQSRSGERGNSENSAYAVDINIFNRYDDHLIDDAYMGNSKVFGMLDSLMLDTVIINHTKSINVISSSSIEGSVPYNTALSQRRMAMIESTFRARYDQIESDMWNFSYTPENWAHLRRAVVADLNVPHRDEVLSIIDMGEHHPDLREYMLKILAGGVPWSYIHTNILPSSRGSVSMLFIPISLSPICPSESVTFQSGDMPEAKLPTYELDPPRYSRPIISIRSNLLLDISTTLNIAVEIPIARRWSLSAEYINPWWFNWDRAITWQIQSLYFDLRYWLSGRDCYNTLTGWSIGAYAGSGCYDLQPFDDTGVQGEYTDYGVTLSYAHNLRQSKHWLMEYTAGVGYVTTHYRNYYTVANSDEYGNIKVHNYPWSEETLRAPVPTRLGVTLCYLINVYGLKRGCGR